MKNRLNEKKIDSLQKSVNDLLNNWDLTHGLARSLRNLKKETALYKNHLEGLNTAKSQNNKTPSCKKVQIGGGSHVLKGYLNI